MEYYTLDWYENFPAAYGIVELPKNCVFFRGYSKLYPVISNRPAYFGSYQTSKSYAKSDSDYILSAFTNKTTLRLLDVRFMKDILRAIFSNHPGKLEFQSTILSFGICSLFHQLRLMNMRFSSGLEKEKLALMQSYKDDILVEQQGVRIAETTNDAETMGFLKGLLWGLVDGFISPVVKSPFHYEKKGWMSPELILFAPHMSNIDFYNDPVDSLPIKSITSFYSETLEPRFAAPGTDHEYKFYMKGGGEDKESIPTVEQLNVMWHTCAELRSSYEKGYTAGYKWRPKCLIGDFNPVPTAEISPWIKERRKKTLRKRRIQN